MSASLSKLTDNLSEIYKKECKGWEERRKIKSVCNFLGFKNNKLNYECKECQKRWLKPINGLIKKDISKFVSLLREGVYPYEYINSWERFDETSLPDKKAFYSELYLENITDEDYIHAQKVFEKFNLKNLSDSHDLYFQSDTLLLADVFENFRNNCIEIYELGPSHFLSAPGLEWQACLKKTEAELELLTDIDMLLMFEKGIRGGICHAIDSYARANNKYMKNYDKNIELLYLMYLDVNNLYGWGMSQNCL